MIITLVEKELKCFTNVTWSWRDDIISILKISTFLWEAELTYNELLKKVDRHAYIPETNIFSSKPGLIYKKLLNFLG